MSKISRVVAINAIEGEFVMEYQVESERGFHALGTTYFSPSMRLPFDPARYSDPNGVSLGERLTDFEPPDGSWVWVWSRWYVDMSSDVDDQGWRYSWHFSSNSWTGKHRFGRSFVRQRLWKRPRVKREVLEHHTNQRSLSGKYMVNSLQDNRGVPIDMPLELLLNPNSSGTAGEWVKKVEKNEDEILPGRTFTEKVADMLGVPSSHDFLRGNDHRKDDDHQNDKDDQANNDHQGNDDDHQNDDQDNNDQQNNGTDEKVRYMSALTPISTTDGAGSTHHGSQGAIASPEVLAELNFSDDSGESFHTVTSLDAPENDKTAISLLNSLAALRNDRERIGYIYDFVVTHPSKLDLLVALRSQILSVLRFPVSRKTLLAKLTQSGNTTAENFALLPNSSWRDQVLLHGEPEKDDQQEDAE